MKLLILLLLMSCSHPNDVLLGKYEALKMDNAQLRSSIENTNTILQNEMRMRAHCEEFIGRSFSSGVRAGLDSLKGCKK
jgi:hypothetical protein